MHPWRLKGLVVHARSAAEATALGRSGRNGFKIVFAQHDNDDPPFLKDLELFSLGIRRMNGARQAASVLEAGAPAKMVVRLREELLALCQGYAANSVRSN